MDFPRQPAELTPNMRHDLLVVDLRIAFEETGADAASWLSDHQLRLARVGLGRHLRTPDGVFEFEEGQKKLKGVLEFELSSYRLPILASVLRRLKTFYSTHTIFFICRTAERAATLRSWCLEIKTWNSHPRQIRIGHVSAAIQDGLSSNFVDLSDL